MKKLLLTSMLVLGLSGSVVASAAMDTTNGNNGSNGSNGCYSPLFMPMVGMHCKMSMMQDIKSLNLTEQQKTQMKELWDKHRAAAKEVHAKLKANAETARTLVGTNYSEAKVNSLAKDQGELIAQLIAMRLNLRQQIFMLLTPEQQEKVKKMSDVFWKSCMSNKTQKSAEEE